MLGLMQSRPLLISMILGHAARHHAEQEVVSRTVEGAIHRYTYRDMEARARRLVRALQHLGVTPRDRVATLAWNGYRHLELYYGVSGMGAIVHTVNPRLAPDDIAYIISHAEGRVLFAETSFAPLVAAIAERLPQVRDVVLMTEAAHMPELQLAPGQRLHCYETLMAAADEDYAWPEFDETTASALCYTSGTTGRPKGVLYSHRSTLLHAFSINMADIMGLRATDTILPVVPMFHVNAWGIPYAAPMAGTKLVMPGRHLDGASLAGLMNAETVTFSAGVPTVWMGLLQHLRASGETLTSLTRLMTGGSACPPLLVEAFAREYNVAVDHGWGMSEMSPVGTYSAAKPATAGLPFEADVRRRLRQGRALFGVDMKIVDDAGRELPWDGAQFGDLMVRGPWVLSRYFGAEEPATDADGWFRTGDVATIDPHGSMEITDRSKDVVKSGGEWISSIALENIAVSHPDVVEAAVIAVRHPKWDERPLLLVVPKEGCGIDAAGLLQSFEGKVAKWWIPDEVLVVDALPHTATGKLNKLALRQRYRDRSLTGTAPG